MNPQYYGAAADLNKPKGPKFLNPKVLIIAGGAVVGLLLLMIIMAVISSLASGPRNDVAKLAARSQQLAAFLETNLKPVQDPDVRKVATETRLYVSTSGLAVSKAFGAELPESIVAGEVDTTSAAELEDATKAGKYDETFLQILGQKVDATLELSQKLQAQSVGQQTKAAVELTTNNLLIISEQIDAIKL